MTDAQTKDRLRSYFSGAGFDSLHLVYGDEACDRFRGAIRRGHSEVIETVVSWLGDATGFETLSVLDAGCGTGSLAVPVALSGARVDAIDFSAKMIEAAKERAGRAQVPPQALRYLIGDLESVCNLYDVVVCIDVFARYSTEAAVTSLKQLGALAKSRMIFTFTPKKVLDPIWMAIGAVVAKSNQAPRLYTHSKEVIAETLQTLGWTICRQAQISAGWNSYFCCLVEARRNGARH